MGFTSYEKHPLSTDPTSTESALVESNQTPIISCLYTWPLVGDCALVEAEAAVVDGVPVGAALHEADLGGPDGADDGVAGTLLLLRK